MAITHTGAVSTARSARLGLRATPEQKAILRRAADVAHKSRTAFIPESACQLAEQTLLDQHLFMVSGRQVDALLELLDRPAEDNAGLRLSFRSRLFGIPGEFTPSWSLGAGHRLESFDCGNLPLNEWLVRYDRRAQSSAADKTFIVSDREWASSQMWEAMRARGTC